MECSLGECTPEPSGLRLGAPESEGEVLMSILDAAWGAKRSTNTRRMRPVSVLVGSAMALVLPFASTLAAVAGGPARPASTALTCDGAWHIVASLNPGPHEDELLGVAAVSPSLAWTVGALFAAN